MSKALLLMVPATLALAGLAVWNVTLQAEVDDLRAAAAATPETSADVSAADRAPVVTERTTARIRDLEQRLLEMERRAASPVAGTKPAPTVTGAVSAADAAPGETSTDALAAPVDAVFRDKVYAVMDQREAERRRERRQREAERQTDRMLRDMTVSDAQRAQVVAVLLSQAESREALRSDEDLPPDVVRQRMTELATERDRQLENVLGVDTMNAIRARDQGQRRRGGVLGGNRRGGGGGAGGRMGRGQDGDGGGGMRDGDGQE